MLEIKNATDSENKILSICESIFDSYELDPLKCVKSGAKLAFELFNIKKRDYQLSANADNKAIIEAAKERGESEIFLDELRALINRAAAAAQNADKPTIAPGLNHTAAVAVLMAETIFNKYGQPFNHRLKKRQNDNISGLTCQCRPPATFATRYDKGFYDMAFFMERHIKEGDYNGACIRARQALEQFIELRFLESNTDHNDHRIHTGLIGLTEKFNIASKAGLIKPLYACEALAAIRRGNSAVHDIAGAYYCGFWHSLEVVRTAYLKRINQ